MSAGEALAACPNPWCKYNDPLVERTQRHMGDASPRRVECDCGIAGPPKPTDDEAITAWNQRVPTTSAGVPQGMVPWAGGDSAPEDWDGGHVWMRDGHGGPPIRQDGPRRWAHTHAGSRGHGFDIIAYTPRATPSQADDSAVREALLTGARAALQGVVSGASRTFKARNGKFVGIEADDGEACDIIHSDITYECERQIKKIDAALQPKASDSGRDDGGSK